MKKLIPQQFIDRLLSNLNVVEIIGKFITIKKNGANYTGLCPFHQEKSPSFVINPIKQFYHCFGCGVSGNIVTFIMEQENLNFIEAIDYLANIAGVPMPKLDENTSYDQTVFDVLDFATIYFTNKLKKTPNHAKDYLISRNISEEVTNNYNLGLADNSFVSMALAKFSMKSLVAAGLVNNNNFRFQNRLMFPIKNSRGKIVGFGSRSIDQKNKIKYLNSPETIAFHKGDLLYGLHEMRLNNNKHDYIIVVEGYMDVLSLAQHDIPNTVALLGTAVSNNQLKLLFQQSKKIIFCFDGDVAGQNAAWRTLNIVLPIIKDDLQINFAILPQEEDPDSYLIKYGKEKFLYLLSQAKSITNFLYRTVVSKITSHLHGEINLKTYFSSTENKRKLAHEIVNVVKNMPDNLFKHLILKNLSRKINVDMEYLTKFILSGKQKNFTSRKIDKTADQNAYKHQLSLVNHTISLIMQNTQLVKNHDFSLFINCFKCLEQESQNITKSDFIIDLKILEKIITIINTNPDISTGILLEYFRDLDENKKIIALSNYVIFEENNDQELEDSIKKVILFINNCRINILIKKADISTGIDNNEKKMLQQLIRQQHS